MAKTQTSCQAKKGGTVVPPSDFQSDTTKCADNKAFQESSSRPRGRSACVRTRVQVRRLYVLIACEESQAECKAFRELGHIAFSCDLQKCRKGGNPDWHIHGDVRPFLQGKTKFRTQSGKRKILPRWDLIIAHPPCTYLCKVGSVHLYKNPDAWVQTIDAEHFHSWQRRLLNNGHLLSSMIIQERFDDTTVTFGSCHQATGACRHYGGATQQAIYQHCIIHPQSHVV